MQKKAYVYEPVIPLSNHFIVSAVVPFLSIEELPEACVFLVLVYVAPPLRGAFILLQDLNIILSAGFVNRQI